MRVLLLGTIGLSSALGIASLCGIALVKSASHALDRLGVAEHVELSAEPLASIPERSKEAQHVARLDSESGARAERTPEPSFADRTTLDEASSDVREEEPPLCDSVFARIVSVSPDHPESSAATLATSKNSHGVFRYVGQAVGGHRIERIAYDALKARAIVELRSRKGVCRARSDSGRTFALPSVSVKKDDDAKKCRRRSSAKTVVRSLEADPSAS
jgi:hypothetical protein